MKGKPKHVIQTSGAGQTSRLEATAAAAAAAAAGHGAGPGNGMRRCQLCGCYVPGSDQSWRTHTTGIRHRRNAASQRVFGEAGHAVVSAFEHFDATAPTTYRGKDVVLLAAQQRQQHTAPASSSKHSRGQPATPHNSQAVVLQQLQRQLRKHLATQVGLGSVYNKAAERFSSEALAGAWQQLQADVARQLQQQQQRQQRTAPAAQSADACDMQQLALQQAPQQEQQQEQPPQQRQQQQQQQQQQQRSDQQQLAECELRLSPSEPAQLACLAHLLPDSVTALAVTVPYQSYGPAAAATCAATACFCCSMSRHHSLRALRLAFSSDQYSAILRQGGASLARLPELWGKALAALSDAMQVNCGLQRLALAAFPCQFPPEALAALQTSLGTSRPRLRAALLAASHPRLGAASPLARLPHELLAALLARAVPREGCSLALELPQGLAGDSSSSEDSSSDDSSSEDNDDSDDEDSSSSSGGSEEGNDGGSGQA